MSTSSSAGAAACARLGSGGFGRPRWGVVTAVGWEVGGGAARSIAKTITIVFLCARSLRQQRRVHQQIVDLGEGSGSEGGGRRALHDPISLLIVDSIVIPIATREARMFKVAFFVLRMHLLAPNLELDSGCTSLVALHGL